MALQNKNIEWSMFAVTPCVYLHVHTCQEILFFREWSVTQTLTINESTDHQLICNSMWSTIQTPFNNVRLLYPVVKHTTYMLPWYYVCVLLQSS